MFCFRIAVILIRNLGGWRVLYCLNIYTSPQFFKCCSPNTKTMVLKVKSLKSGLTEFPMSGLCPYKRDLAHQFYSESTQGNGVICEAEHGSSLGTEP